MSKFGKNFWFVFRSFLGLAALAALFWFGKIDFRLFAAALHEPALLTAAMLLIASAIPIAALRWWLLLRGLGFPMSLGWSLRVTLTSLFSSTFLPGAYGGDLVRVTLAYRQAQTGLSRLAFTVLIDRCSGILGLMTIGLIAIPGLGGRVQNQASVTPMLLLLSAGFLAALLGFLLGRRLSALLARSSLRPVVKIAEILKEIAAALNVYIGQWKLLVSVFALSILMFAGNLGAILLLGLAMHFYSLSAAGYAIAGTWALLANALPVTPGGLGVGEALFAQTSHLLEATATATNYATVFLAMRILSILASAPGAWTFAFHRRDIQMSAGML